MKETFPTLYWRKRCVWTSMDTGCVKLPGTGYQSLLEIAFSILVLYFCCPYKYKVKDLFQLLAAFEHWYLLRDENFIAICNAGE